MRIRWLLVVALWGSAAVAGEPEVTFRVVGTQLTIVVMQDEHPCSDVTVRIFAGETETVWETAQTDAHGQCVVRLPEETVFGLELHIGSRTADRITLTKVDHDRLVVPKMVQLTFGLAPCCRVWDRYADRTIATEENVGMLPPWAKVFLACVSVVGGVVFLGRAWHLRQP